MTPVQRAIWDAILAHLGAVAADRERRAMNERLHDEQREKKRDANGAGAVASKGASA
jgi:hypothetical protein